MLEAKRVGIESVKTNIEEEEAGSSGYRKRILLSDPQYIQQELTRFQSELQELQVKDNTKSSQLTDLQNKLYDLEEKDTDLETKNNDLQSKLNDFETKNTDLRAKFDELQTKYNNLNSQLSGNKGAVFTRWGREDCPANVTTIVYSGYAGGSSYEDTGAAAEYICMPNDPIWGPHKDIVDISYPNMSGYVYGGEYEVPSALFGMPNLQEDVPCAVCLGNKYTATLLIPGRTQCYPGWTEAYHGDLVSGRIQHLAASQYICVDQHPQAVPGGGNREEDGKLFYGVKSKCGPLPCPPYEDEKYLSCVICMK